LQHRKYTEIPGVRLKNERKKELQNKQQNFFHIYHVNFLPNIILSLPINIATQKIYRNTWSKDKKWKEKRTGKQQTKTNNTTSSIFIT